MLKKLLLVLLLIPSFFTGKSNPVLKTVVSDPTIYNSYVDEAATLEEQVDTDCSISFIKSSIASFIFSARLLKLTVLAIINVFKSLYLMLIV